VRLRAWTASLERRSLERARLAGAGAAGRGGCVNKDVRRAGRGKVPVGVCSLTHCVRGWQVEEDKITTIIKDLEGKDVSQINEMIAEYVPVPALAAPRLLCVRVVCCSLLRASLPKTGAPDGSCFAAAGKCAPTSMPIMT